MRRIPSSLVRLSSKFHASDLIAAAIAPSLAILLREPTYFARNEVEPIAGYSVIALVATYASLYHFRIGQILSRFLSLDDIVRILKAVAAAVSLTSAVAFTFMRLDTIPRSMPALHIMVLTAILIGSRALISEHYRRVDNKADPMADKMRENVLLVGATRMAWLYIRMLACLPNPRQRIIALLDEDAEVQGRSLSGFLVAGTLSSAESVLVEYATHGVSIDRLLVMYPDPEERRAAEEKLTDLCERRGVKLEFMADRLDMSLSASLDHAEQVATHSAAMPATQLARYWRFRRVVDVLVAGAALVLLSPLFVLVAMVVAIDIGVPVVFWQERVGRHGLPIAVHKFRTFASPVDRHGRAVPDALRLSGIGRFLRATRLDELPQLYDVLRGSMSLIGPRPLLPIDLAKESSIRHQARPGITGWAQVHGGKLVTPEEKNALDEWYIAHASLAVDFRILRLTLLAPIRGDRRRTRELQRAIQFRAERQGAVGADAGLGAAAAASDAAPSRNPQVQVA